MNSALNPETESIVRGLTWILCGFALFLPISIAVAQPLAYLAVFGWIIICIQRKHRWEIPVHSLYWPMLAFAGIALISIFYSVRPSVSAAKVPRLLLMGLVPLIGTIPDWQKRGLAHRLAAAFAVGCTARALYHLGAVLIRSRAGVNPFDLGNMRDPQMYLTAWFILLGFIAYVPDGGCRRWSWGSLLAVAAGLLLNFKRGAWLAFLIATLVVVGAARKWRWLSVVVLMVVCIWVCPWTRDRVAESRREFSARFGGRYTLWTQVAPAMLREFPWGMGYAASRNSDFLRYAPRVQPGLHHLHNNILQVALELGWVGLAAWVWWIVACLVAAFRNYYCARHENPGGAAISLGVLGAFVGLLGNGIVEYNFGDSEILMLWFLLSGLVVRLSFEGTREPCAGEEKR